MPELRAVAVAVDGSPAADQAFEWAVTLAKLASASLTIVGVVPAVVRFAAPSGEVVESRSEGQRYMPELLSRYVDSARRRLPSAVDSAILEGPVVDELLVFLDERRPQILVVGARGLSRSRRLLLGSVSDAIAHHATCSVLIVRAPRGRSTSKELRGPTK